MNSAARSAATRQRLLDATWDVVRTEGLQAATSRRITTVAGANLGAITYHFGSKDHLLGQAAVARIRSWAGPLGDALVADEDDGGDRTDTTIAGLLDGFGRGAADGQALLEVLVAGRDLPEPRAVVRAELDRFHRLVADHLTRRRDRGEIPASVVPDAMAGLFTAFALGLVVQDVIGATPAPVAAIVGQLLTLLTEGDGRA